MSLLAQINEKHMKLVREEEAEKNASISGSSINGGRKINDDNDLNTLLNNYAQSKSKFDQYYKTLTPDQIKKYKEEFKEQEEALTNSNNLLNKKNKYYIGNKLLNYVKKKIE